jgi:pyroglutamyl-peptidase
MLRIIVTCFEPYDVWSENASWLALVDFTRDLPSGVKITTRRYPVNFAAVQQRLEQDLEENFDYALHLGQAPGTSTIRLEAIGVNIGGASAHPPETYQPLIPDGPVAYRSELPLGDWASLLREAGIPATVSYHAGTYLCNATLYLTHHFARQKRLNTRATFVHVPLDPCQSARHPKEIAALPAALAARGLRLIITDLVQRGESRPLQA